MPFTFDIALGVAQGDVHRRDQLQRALDRDAAAIRQILDDYHVPLIDRIVPPADPSHRDVSASRLAGEGEEEAQRTAGARIPNIAHVARPSVAPRRSRSSSSRRAAVIPASPTGAPRAVRQPARARPPCLTSRGSRRSPRVPWQAP